MSSLLSSVRINDIHYNNVKELIAHHPHIFGKFKNRPRTIIEKKNIGADNHLFACFVSKTNTWNTTTNACKSAQLLIAKNWVDSVILSEIKAPAEPLPKEKEKEKEVEKENVEKEEGGIDAVDAIIPVVPIIKERAPPIPLPPVIKLQEHEKIKDCNGQSVPIKVVGEKHVDKIYFSVKDTMKWFNMLNLNSTLSHQHSTYEYGIHYVLFNRKSTLDNVQRVLANGNETPIEPINGNMHVLYLTYLGMIKVLFSSNTSGIADKFQRWAIETLFTVQMGTKDKKIEMAASLIGTPVSVIKTMMRVHANKMVVIYLKTLGIVKDLREQFNIPPEIPDDHILCKYGKSIDVEQRSTQNTEYVKYPNVVINVFTFHIIDEKYLAQAEAALGTYFKAFNCSFSFKGHRELVILNKDQMEQTRKQYGYIGRQFMGATQEIQNELLKEKTKYELLEERYKYKELEMVRSNELLEEKYRYKELELMHSKESAQYRIELLELKLSLK